MTTRLTATDLSRRTKELRASSEAPRDVYPVEPQQDERPEVGTLSLTGRRLNAPRVARRGSLIVVYGDGVVISATEDRIGQFVTGAALNMADGDEGGLQNNLDIVARQIANIIGAPDVGLGNDEPPIAAASGNPAAVIDEIKEIANSEESGAMDPPEAVAVTEAQLKVDGETVAEVREDVTADVKPQPPADGNEDDGTGHFEVTAPPKA